QAIRLWVRRAIRLHAVFERARHVDESASRGNHRDIRCAESFLGAIADIAHAFGHRAILRRDAFDAGKAFGTLLFAIQKIVVALVLVEQPRVDRQTVIEPELTVRAVPRSDTLTGL